MIDFTKPMKKTNVRINKHKKIKRYKDEEMSQFFFNGIAAPILTILFGAFGIIIVIAAVSAAVSLAYWDSSYMDWLKDGSIKEWKYFSIVVRVWVGLNFVSWWVGSIIYYLGEEKCKEE